MGAGRAGVRAGAGGGRAGRGARRRHRLVPVVRRAGRPRAAQGPALAGRAGAKPGTSDHGWGKSLDLRLDASAQRWMRQHADEYGFTENVSREPWHWTFDASDR
nr:D-alanyl-D-alanine carboxypeptidase family protein [Angustibacter aerolatus]